MPTNVLRNLPSVSELLESPPLKKLVDRVSHNVVVGGPRFSRRSATEVQTAATELKVRRSANLPNASPTAYWKTTSPRCAR